MGVILTVSDRTSAPNPGSLKTGACKRCNHMMIRLTLGIARIGILSVTGLWGALALAQDFSIVIDSVNVRQQGTITFREFLVGEVPGLSQDIDQVSTETDDHKYRIVADLNSIKPGRFGTFNVDLYVQEAAQPNARFFKFTLTGAPVGGFLDVDESITIHVLRGNSESKAAVDIPLHNSGQVDLLSSDSGVLMRELNLGQEKNVDFRFANKLDNLRLIVANVSITPECEKCWNAKIPVKTPLEAPENQIFDIPVSLQPTMLSALWSSALKLKSDEPHDHLAFDITYHAGYGGQVRTQRFTFPVRFAPSLLALVLAVSIGIALGFVTSLFVDKDKRASPQAAVRALGVAILLSVVVEIIGLVLAAYGSKVLIFGFDLDPRQFLPAVVIAILVSGGSSVVSAIKDVFGRGGGG